jgi:hypothetical protein
MKFKLSSQSLGAGNEDGVVRIMKKKKDEVRCENGCGYIHADALHIIVQDVSKQQKKDCL